MKLTSILLTFMIVSCVNKFEGIDYLQEMNRTQETYSTFTLDNFTLTLKNIEGQCALFYKQLGEKEEKQFIFEMTAPCEFIRVAPKIDKVQHHTYLTGVKRIHVVIIAGGPPDAEFPHISDKFRPEGCGSQVQKIQIFKDRIEVGDWIKNVGPSCASAGLDEKWYAT